MEEREILEICGGRYRDIYVSTYLYVFFLVFYFILASVFFCKDRQTFFEKKDTNEALIRKKLV